MPGYLFMASRRLIVFDHLTHQIKVIVFAQIEGTGNLKAIYDPACEEVNDMVAELQRPLSFLPEYLNINAWTKDGEIMGLRHCTYPVEGVQFHSEYILTEGGGRMIDNFTRLIMK